MNKTIVLKSNLASFVQLFLFADGVKPCNTSGDSRGKQSKEVSGFWRPDSETAVYDDAFKGFRGNAKLGITRLCGTRRQSRKTDLRI